MDEKNAGNADWITREYFDSLLLEMRHIDGKKPDTAFSLFGKNFKTPIMTAALSHLQNICPDGMVQVAKGAALAGAVNWAGMGEKKELEEIGKSGAATIKIIKPYADKEIIFDKLAHAERCGVLAVGMDIDHGFTANGEYDEISGERMEPKTMEEIREFTKATRLPFIVKGVLSCQDAYKSVEAGAKGIVVSHHHGIMDYSVPPLQLLPDIIKAVGKEIPVFVDCGITSGMDAFKALALGASAVCVGRALLQPLSERGADGVRDKLLEMNEGLKGIMARTGCYDLAHMDASVLHRRKPHF